MQISAYETTSGLERKLSINIAANELDSKIDKKLNELSRTVKLDGFRPGKVPLRVIKQKFYGSVRNEIVTEAIQSSLNEAFGEKSIRPANQPSIEIHKNIDGEELSFDAVFEVYPEVEDLKLTNLEVKQPKCDITDKEIDTIIDRWRKARANWEVVDRAAEDGDRVRIDYVCKIDGEEVEDASGNDANVIIGANMMLKGFEEGLLGAKKDSEVVLDIEMPQGHKNDKLAGKQAKVTVNVKEVEKPILPEVNEDFCKEHGVPEGGVEKLREQVKLSLENELKNRVHDAFKQSLFEQLLDNHEVELPKAMVKAEKEVLVAQHAQQTGNADVAADSELDKDIQEQAERSVKLGILIGAYVNKENIQPDQGKVLDQVRQIAMMYGEPEQAMQQITQNQNMMSRIIASTLEDQAVEKIKDLVKVVDVETTFDELSQG